MAGMYTPAVGSEQPPTRQPVSRLSDVVVDAVDAERLASFWGTLLGLEVTSRGPTYVILRPLPVGMQLTIQAVPEPKAGKNRLHLDITVPDQDAAVARVIALGGRHFADVEDWRVMADPEGNEFCLLRDQ